MEFVRQTVSTADLADFNSVFMNLPPSLRNKRVDIIIMPSDTADVSEKPKQELKLGFLDLPPLPNGFFEPLPEEDLQAWGL
ncbi:MAG: hypothetical protein FWH20_05740 [Oscillospiraceae bacterium]|nr:hypothetical protein [Oscillospiraceae bacterium]